ncbi:Alpha-xylosidase BoGH31A [Massilia sp. Bi118]|uniref:glycoside hydrolase family 31 protein n=1 Tax=Massilia sp. Bi118 TaxID=2822346 RepID=UPI001E17448C|nr:glycoside hydrolase family 31 protein [Massilia sp. Bi118]CAH0211097.1 Alpha-xylosidase BoGH31A [Massilia sp. Bi118]
MRTSRLLRILAGAGLIACIAFSAMPAAAALRTVGAVVQSTPTDDGVDLRLSSGARVHVGFVTPDVLRVRMNPGGRFDKDVSYAIAGAIPTSRATLTKQGTTIELRSGSGIRAVIRTSPELAISVYDGAGRLVVAADPARPMAFNTDGGAVETAMRRDDYELYYGFGEKTLPLSRHQQATVMWNADVAPYPEGHDPSYQAIPFFIALHEGRSYGLFFNNTWRSWFDMGKTEPHRYSFGANGGELDYYVFSGGKERTPAGVLRDYTLLTGRGALPPLWALGYQQSRWSYMSQEKVLDVAREFRRRRIPADVLYLDIDHMDGFRVFTWNPKTFPDPKSMLGQLHEQGFHAVTIVDPGIKVDRNYAIYRSGREQGVYVKNADGSELHAKVWPGICAFPDFTSPAARAWFGGLYEAALDIGVDGFWNDMNEPGVFPADGFDKPEISLGPQRSFPIDVRHAGDGRPGSHAQYHNVYGMQMARASFEGLRSLRPDRRPLVLTRAGYAGVQRYAAVWTGDNSPTWSHLALTIPMLTNLSVSGVPFVGADVGGFMGSPSAELHTRWLQAAALTPYFRTHSSDVSAPREPWAFGAGLEAINRSTIELRYRLLPYLYTLFEESERTGLPPMRPLWFAYPGDTRAALVDDQFLLGADLLVAPVLREGQRKREVYFPKGDAWLDWWDGSRHEGGSAAMIAAPLDRLPLFVRAGASVPVSGVVQHTGEMKGAGLTLAVAVGGEGTSHVFQDAGDGYGYREGRSRRIAVAQDGQGLRLDIPRNRGYQRVEAIEFIGLRAAPAGVHIDGKPVQDLRFDAAARRLRMALPDESVKRITLVQ